MSHYTEIQTCTLPDCLEAVLSLKAGDYLITPLPSGHVSKFVMKLRYHVFKAGYKLKTRKEGKKMRMWLLPLPPRVSKPKDITDNWNIEDELS